MKERKKNKKEIREKQNNKFLNLIVRKRKKERKKFKFKIERKATK